MSAAAVAAAVLMTGSTMAVADPGSGPETYPSQQQVDDARADVATKQQGVEAIRAALAAANERLERANIAAAVAAERYNGARWQLSQARAEAKESRAEAREAARRVRSQRDGIAMLVTQTYQDGTALNGINAFMGPGGPTTVMKQYGVVQTASASMQSKLDAFAVLSRRAARAEKRAHAAQQKQQTLFDEAAAARNAAAAAADAAAGEAARIAATRQQLLTDLARAQNISVELATQRQTALEEQARERAAAAQREQQRQAAQEAAQQAAREASQAASREAAQRDARAAARRAASRAAQQERANDRPAPAPAPAPPPPPPPAPAPPPAPSGGVDAVIAYAKAQLGEPYVWGAAGPSAWDCSGLMMRAWEQAGVSLPHWSVGQYYASTPIGSSDLRRGDLVFWSDTGSPDGIFHVAMYIGDGQIIHAPRTGQPVQIASMYYWVPPDYFARP